MRPSQPLTGEFFGYQLALVSYRPWSRLLGLGHDGHGGPQFGNTPWHYHWCFPGGFLLAGFPPGGFPVTRCTGPLEVENLGGCGCLLWRRRSCEDPREITSEWIHQNLWSSKRSVIAEDLAADFLDLKERAKEKGSRKISAELVRRQSGEWIWARAHCLFDEQGNKLMMCLWLMPSHWNGHQHCWNWVVASIASAWIDPWSRALLAVADQWLAIAWFQWELRLHGIRRIFRAYVGNGEALASCWQRRVASLHTGRGWPRFRGHGPTSFG